MLILDLWGVSFYAAVVFGLGKDFLFKSTLGHRAKAIRLEGKRKVVGDENQSNFGT